MQREYGLFDLHTNCNLYRKERALQYSVVTEPLNLLKICACRHTYVPSRATHFQPRGCTRMVLALIFNDTLQHRSLSLPRSPANLSIIYPYRAKRDECMA